jgi:hypothetical protein
MLKLCLSFRPFMVVSKRIGRKAERPYFIKSMLLENQGTSFSNLVCIKECLERAESNRQL